MQMLPTTSGIYTITNKISNKIYVGYTTNFRKRRDQHYGFLRRNSHKNPHLQAAWNKYGEDAFEFEILIHCNKEFLCSEEHYWCNLLNVHNPKFGYNDKPTLPYGNPSRSKESIEKGRIKLKKYLEENSEARNRIANIAKNMGYHYVASQKIWTDKERLDMSIRKKEYGVAHLNTPEVIEKRNRNKRKIPILQYDLQENFIKEWESMAEAERKLNIPSQNIGLCCRYYKNTNNTKCTYAGNYIWKYKN